MKDYCFVDQTTRQIKKVKKKKKTGDEKKTYSKIEQINVRVNIKSK